MRLVPNVAVLALAILVSACGSDSSPAPAPSPTPTPTPPVVTTFALSGRVTAAGAGTGIPGALITVLDGPNAGKVAGADGNGNYNLIGLTSSGFTVSIVGNGFVTTTRPVSLSGNVTLNVSLLPAQIFQQSGSGDNVFTVPSHVTRIRVDASYPGSCQNFIVRISSQTLSLINIIIGTCSVADTRSPFSGTYAIQNGGTVTITNSTGVAWTFTEVR
jgi:hypothetical protein